MKIIFTCTLFLLLAIGSNAQRAFDSASYYAKELSRIHQAYHDSMKNDPRYREAMRNMSRTKMLRDDYTAFTLCTHVASADFSRLNADNAALGFSRISGPGISIGYGFSFKKNRRVFDLYAMALGIPKKAKRGEEELRANFSTLLQLEWGYDLVRNRLINIYPYAGVGLRDVSLRYDAEAQINANPANITDVVETDASVQDNIGRVGYQAGIGFEFVLTGPDNAGGILVFLKAGTNRPFKKETFDFHGYRYPGFNYGNWVVTAGFKFFGRD